MNRAAAEQRGHWGEWLAVLWLRLHGWRILGQRVRVHAGEVDIVARRGKTLAFIEVKTRSRAEDLDLSIDAWRLRRVAAAASVLLPRYTKADDDTRIDAIFIAPWRLPRHLIHIWHG